MNRYPLRVEAHRDDTLSRWLWLVKWLLLIPHYVVLLFLWLGFVVLTVVAYLAVLFTGRYPQTIRDYNLGVLRWSWRVNYYGYETLATDRYPPFTLADVPDYPARLHLDVSARPPRWLPLVAWLFAIPHLLLLGALTGAATWNIDTSPDTTVSIPLGVITVGVTIVALSLLFTGRYPRGLYDLLLGVARWNLRVAAYLALLTPRYPPFRLDQGEGEPGDLPTGPSGLLRPAQGAAGSPGLLPPARDPAGNPAANGRGSAAGAVSALIAGVVLLVPSAAVATAGGALLALDAARDSSGYVTSPLMSVRTDTAAVTGEGLTFSRGDDLWIGNISDVGGIRVAATSSAAMPLFVGVAPQSAVDGWLAGIAHDELVGIPAGQPRYDRTAGTMSSAAAPVDQHFWLASSTGSDTVTLDWKATNGNFAVVVANADGSPTVAADVRAAAQIPDLTGLGAGTLTAGILLGLLAITLIVIGGVALGRRHRTTPGPPAPSGGLARTPSPTAPPVPVS